jgi:hypothetical protein
VLRGALEYMQQYNGGTKTCIFMAMGYEDCVGRRIHKSNRPWVTYKNWKQLAEAKAEERERASNLDRKPHL